MRSRSACDQIASLLVCCICVNLLGCERGENRTEQWQKSLALHAKAEEAGQVVAACMSKSVRAEAAYEIGLLEVREGRQVVNGSTTYQVTHGPLTAFPKSSDQLVSEVAEALAVHCGVSREDWQSQPRWLKMDSWRELETDRGAYLASLSIANGEFLAAFRKHPRYLAGRAEALARKKDREIAEERQVEGAKARKHERMRDFAVE